MAYPSSPPTVASNVKSESADSHYPDDQEWGRVNRPVIDVSWEDARQYVRWLSRKTGERYRLLSESEWEYVARAGTTTRFNWGNEAGYSRANCAGCGSRRDSNQTSPLGSFSPNAFGLYDVHGNVWEWVEDCWHDDYEGAPSDGSAWTAQGDCSRRVLRGGSAISSLGTCVPRLEAETLPITGITTSGFESQES